MAGLTPETAMIDIVGTAADFAAALDESASAAEETAAGIAASFTTASADTDATASQIAASFDASFADISTAAAETAAKMDASFDAAAASASEAVAGSSAAAAEEMASTTAVAGDGMVDDLGAAGIAAGAAARDGVSDGAAGVADDLSKTGEDAGSALAEGVTSSTAGMADELASAGVLAGGGLASGVHDGAEGVADDLGTIGEDSGVALKDGASEGLSGIKGMLSNIGVPESMLTGWGELATGVAAVTAVSMDLAEKMQGADTAIANSAGISTSAAKAIGTSFLHMGGEFDGKEIATSFAQVAGQLKSAQGQALSTKQAYTFMTVATTLATAKQASLGSTTSTMASVMQAYSMKVKTASTASDILFEASNATGQSVTAVGTAVDKVKTKLGGLAPSLGTISGLLVDMADHGETGRAAMSSLTTAFTAFLKPAATAQKDQDDLNVAMKNLTPTLASLAKQYQAGKLSMTAMTAATEAMTPKQAALWSEFTSSASALDTSNQAMEKMGISALTATGKLRPLKTIIGQLHAQIAGMSTAQATAQLTADGFGSSAAKLVKVIQAGPGAFSSAADAVTKMGTAQAGAAKQGSTLDVQFKTMKATADDWLTELGQVALPVLGDFVSGIGHVASAIGDVIDWFKKMSDPALAVAAAIGAVLTPAIVGWGVSTVSSAVDSVTAWGSAMAAAITSGDAQVISAEGVATAVDASAADQEAAFLTTSAAAIGAGLKQVAAFAETGAGWVVTGAQAVAGAAVQVAAWVSTAAAATAAFVAENLATLGIVAGLAAVVAGVVYMATHWEQVWGDVKSIALDVWQALESAFDDALGFIEKWGPLVAEAILAPFTGGMSLILPEVIEHWGDVESFLEGIPGKIEALFSDAGSWLLSAGKDILEGLKNGIEDGVKDVLGAVKSVGSDIVSGFKSVLSIFSPSTITYTHGRMLDQGLANGILDGVGGITSAAKIAGDAALGAFNVSGSAAIAAHVAAGGTSNPAAVGGGGSAVAVGGGGGTVHLSITVNNNGSLTDAKQLATTLAPLIAAPLRTRFLQQKRSLGGTTYNQKGLGLS